MTERITNRRRLAGYAVLIVLALLMLGIPAVQNAVAGALIEFIQITERAMHIPCALLGHDKRFSLDRFDPTCPQCM